MSTWFQHTSSNSLQQHLTKTLNIVVSTCTCTTDCLNNSHPTHVFKRSQPYCPFELKNMATRLLDLRYIVTTYIHTHTNHI